MPTTLNSMKSATRTAPAITIAEHAPHAFRGGPAGAAGDSRRRGSTGGRSAAAAAAASSMEHALIGSTASKSRSCTGIWACARGGGIPPHSLEDKSKERVIVGKEKVTDLQTRRDTPPIPLRPSPSAKNAERFFLEGILRAPGRRRDLAA